MEVWKSSELAGLWEAHSHLRQLLKDRAYRPVLDLPINRWVRCEDRGLSRELVRRSVRNLIDLSFDNLLQLPGVGVVKLRVLIKLLDRVRTERPEDVGTATSRLNLSKFGIPSNDSFSVQWLQDAETVRKSRLHAITLGRMAPSLRGVPRTLWEIRLERFCGLKFDQLQTIPYFGPKRVAFVIKVMSEIANFIRTGRKDTSTFSWHVPFVEAANKWVAARVSKPSSLQESEVCMGLVEPILAQLAMDLDHRAVEIARLTIANAAGERFLLHRASPVHADLMGMSRPRASQMKSDVRLALKVRWPNGAGAMRQLVQQAADVPNAYETVDFLRAVESVFFDGLSMTLPSVASDETAFKSYTQRPARITRGNRA